MPHIPHIPRLGAQPAESADTFVAWPQVDTLYDYTQVLSDKSPIASVPEALRGKRVCIIGAGAAGICAAYELFRAGLDPVVYEATDRIGGRTDSRYFRGTSGESGVIAELGAMRVPTSCKAFYHYAGLLDLKYADFPDPGKVFTKLYYDNHTYDWYAGQKPPGPFEKIHDDFTRFIASLTDPVFDPWKRGDLDGVRSAWQALIDRYADASFIHAITQGIPKWGPRERKAFGALGMGSGGFGPLYPVGFLEMLRVLVNQWETDQQLIRYGIGGLVDGLHARVVQRPDGSRSSLAAAGLVHCKSPVKKIARHGNTVTVTIAGPNDTRTEDYDAVIVACTSHAMEYMGLTLPESAGSPPDESKMALGADARSALRNLPLVNTSKLFIRTKTKFWAGDDDMPENIQTDELPRGIYCLDYPQTDNGVVLVSYTWRDDATRLTACPPEQRFEMFLRVIEKIDPRFAAELVPEADELVVVDWQSRPYYYGGFKLDQPGQETFVQNVYYQFLDALDASVDTGVYLAGDSVSFAGGWTEGALETGLNAAFAVLARIGVDVGADSPLSQRKDLYDYARRSAAIPG
jgi:tryptophan 2-monooxygenase